MASAYSVNDLKSESDEWLLAKRGACTVGADTQEMIANEMLRRSLVVPPLPKKPVHIDIANSKKSYDIPVFLLIVAFVLGMKKLLLENFVFLVVTVIAIVAYVIYWDKNRTKGKNNGVTELMNAAGIGDVERMIDLINYGAGVNDKTKSGFTPLMYAGANGQVDAFKLLLSHGADYSSKSKQGKTAIEVAVDKGFEEQFTNVDLVVKPKK